MNLKEKRIDGETIYSGRIISLVDDKVVLPDGTTARREVVRHNGGVCVAALTENKELLFVRQFRYPYNEVVLELPAGKLEKGQTPLENGKRELLEETGAVGREYVSLGQLYPTPGYCSEIIYLYFCKVDSIGNSSPDEGEFLTVEKIPLDSAVEMVLNNQISDAKTQVLIMKTAMLTERGIIK